MNIEIKPNTQNAYILFGWEAIEARPNLDPFDGTLRTYPETQQVYTSDVHIKHHARRGISAAAEELKIKSPEIYYEKTNDEGDGNARSVDDRVKAIQKNHPEVKSGMDVYKTCLDLPLFGFVWAKSKEAFHKNGAVNTILRPTTFHSSNILSLGRNNAFANNGAASAGSATIDVLEYGFFLALLEINLPTLKENTEGHSALKGDANAWMNLLANGLWKAYTSHRFPSFTQRSQYAKFLLAWTPKDEGEIDPVHPRQLIELLGENQMITNSVEAKAGLKKTLPTLLKGWQYSPETEAGRAEKDTFLSDILKG